eukprot:6204879-Pleurochrysis_carterae.AAC.1
MVLLAVAVAPVVLVMVAIMTDTDKPAAEAEAEAEAEAAAAAEADTIAKSSTNANGLMIRVTAKPVQVTAASLVDIDFKPAPDSVSKKGMPGGDGVKALARRNTSEQHGLRELQRVETRSCKCVGGPPLRYHAWSRYYLYIFSLARVGISLESRPDACSRTHSRTILASAHRIARTVARTMSHAHALTHASTCTPTRTRTRTRSAVHAHILGSPCTQASRSTVHISLSPEAALLQRVFKATDWSAVVKHGTVVAVFWDRCVPSCTCYDKQNSARTLSCCKGPAGCPIVVP